MAEREQDRVTARAIRDEAFRKRLLSNPKAALQELGVTVPANITVHVHEETSSNVHIVIPGAAPGGRELSGEELEHVAGGMRMERGGTSCCTCGSSTSQTIQSLQNGCGC